jgi:hypothetical protein
VHCRPFGSLQISRSGNRSLFCCSFDKIHYMKKLLSILSFILLLIPQTRGQTFAFKAQPMQDEFNYSSIANYHHSRPHNKKMLIGGIIAASGGLITIIGVSMIFIGTETTYDLPPDTGLRDGGIVVGSVGFVIAMVGGIIAAKGLKEKRASYGFKIISPKKNEIGLAYNF